MDDRLLMEAIHRRHDEISSEVSRNRLGTRLSLEPSARGWRKAIGRIVIGIGRIIEGN